MNALFRIPLRNTDPGAAPAGPSSSSTESNHVEYAYAFDVAINAFFPSFLTLGVVQLLFVAIITKSNWVCMWLGNTIYLMAYVLPVDFLSFV